MKLVIFSNGKYGLITGNWFSGYKFIDKTGDTWSGRYFIVKYCQFDTLKEVNKIKEKFSFNYRVLD